MSESSLNISHSVILPDTRWNFLIPLNSIEPNALTRFGVWSAGLALLEKRGPYLRKRLAQPAFTILWIPVQGRCRIESEGKQVEAAPGEAILRRADLGETITLLDGTFEHLHFKFNSRRALSVEKIPCEDYAILADLVRIVRAESRWTRRRPVDTYPALFELIRAFLERMLDHRPLADRMDHMMDLLMEEPEKAWTPRKLAAALHISESLLYKLCRERFSMSATAKIAETKMRHADEMLAYTDESLETVAQRLGYSSSFAFSKAYHRIRGIRPGKQRRRLVTERRGPTDDG